MIHTISKFYIGLLFLCFILSCNNKCVDKVSPEEKECFVETYMFNDTIFEDNLDCIINLVCIDSTIDFEQNENIFKRVKSLTSLSIMKRKLTGEFYDFFCNSRIKFLSLSRVDAQNIPKCWLNDSLYMIQISSSNIRNLQLLYEDIPNLKNISIYNMNFEKFPIDSFVIANANIISLIDFKIEENIFNFFPKKSIVKELRLVNSSITHFPNQLLNYKNLKVLELDNNLLVKIPENIFENRNLKEITLGWNKLKNLNFSAANKYNLELLFLNNNELTNLPNNIIKFNRLRNFRIDGNFIETLNLDSLPNDSLEYLVLDNNKIKSLEGRIQRFSRVKGLYLSNNELKQLPKGIEFLFELEELSIAGNPLDSFPFEILELPKLKKISLPLKFKGIVNDERVKYH